MELLRLLVAVGELSEAGGRRTGEERRIVHLSATQLHPTPARLWWSLRPCQRVKQRLLARNLFSASATLRQPVSPRQPSGPQHWAGTWPQRGAGTEPKNRSRAHHSTDSSKCRTGANCFFLEVTRGRCRSVRLAQ